MDHTFYKDDLTSCEKEEPFWFVLKRFLFPLMGFLSMMIGLLYLLYFAEGPSSPSSIPIIRAQCGPLRVKPENPGGKAVPHKDKLVYDCIQKEKTSPSPEVFLSGPEEPIDLPVEKEDVKSLTYTPPASSVPLSSVPSPSLPKEERKAALMPPQKTEVSPGPSPSLQTKKISPYPKRWTLDLSSFRTKTEAEKEKRRISFLLKGMKGKFPVSMTKMDLGDKKGFSYRLFLGPFSTITETKKAYYQLKTRKIHCTMKESTKWG